MSIFLHFRQNKVHLISVNKMLYFCLYNTNLDSDLSEIGIARGGQAVQ